MQEALRVQARIGCACAALMLACKETAVLHFFALAAAALLYWLWNLRGGRVLRVCGGPNAADRGCGFPAAERDAVHLVWQNWKALAALLHAVPNFACAPGGEGHQKPFWYFAQLLTGGWSGGMICALACIGFFWR
jgi:hypothetical protein